jgi:hypothetical protein
MANFSSAAVAKIEGQPAGKLSSEPDEESMPGSRRLHIPHDAIVRAPGLLPMLYKPSELCAELGVPAKVVHFWLRLGLPHQRDGRGHIWVSGKELSSWLLANRSVKRSSHLQTGEGYCFRCARPVRMTHVEKVLLGKVVLLRGKCPLCGSGVNCGARDGQ